MTDIRIAHVQSSAFSAKKWLGGKYEVQIHHMDFWVPQLFQFHKKKVPQNPMWRNVFSGGYVRGVNWHFSKLLRKYREIKNMHFFHFCFKVMKEPNQVQFLGQVFGKQKYQKIKNNNNKIKKSGGHNNSKCRIFCIFCHFQVFLYIFCKFI